MENDRTITGWNAINFGQDHVDRAGDMLAGMFVRGADVDQLRAGFDQALRLGGG